MMMLLLFACYWPIGKARSTLCLRPSGGRRYTGKHGSVFSGMLDAAARSRRMDALKWWQQAVFYQIYPRSFADGNGDGIGDFPGMTRKLDYLRDLGVDALWLSPHYPSPFLDCGYDISDYTGVGPEYGSLQDFTTFLRAAHARGIRVILDLVLNHTSDEHPWFLESRSSRDSPKRDWYIWHDGKAGGSPNNW